LEKKALSLGTIRYMQALDWIALSMRLEDMRASEAVAAAILDVPLEEFQEKLAAARMLRMQMLFVSKG
jgi:hypothetical protein